MNLQELLKRLALGELSNLSFSEGGEITDASLPKVMEYVNEGLLRLHSRLILREDDVLVEMHEGIATYELKPEYALSYEGDIEVPRKYIIDTGPKKFKGDVIRITRVVNSFGWDLELNNPLSVTSVHTPRPKVLQVPVPIPGQALSVVYQAEHPLLVQEEPETQEIELPGVLVGALAAFAASMAFECIGGQENMIRAASFMSKYEKICMEIEEKDGMGTQMQAHTNAFEQKGWV